MVSFFDHWQTLIGALLAGLLGFSAAIWTIRRTLQSESRKTATELESIKKALGAEIRTYAHQALIGHHACKTLANGHGNFSLIQIQSAARFPDPVIYPNVAGRLGLIGDEAHWIVFFFGSIQVFLDGRRDLARLPSPDSITPPNAIFATDALLDACEAAAHILPLVRSGDYYTDQDSKFAAAVSAARDAWFPEKRRVFTSPLS